MEKETQHAIHALVVDDQAIGRDILMEMLHLFDVKVNVADSGHEALREYDLRDFNVIFLDIKMPEMDGLEVAREIRRREIESGKTPVILVAYSADIFVDNEHQVAEHDLKKFETHGFDYCMPKPIKKRDVEVFLNTFPHIKHTIEEGGY